MSDLFGGLPPAPPKKQMTTDDVLDLIRSGLKCECGADAHFGSGVSIQKGKAGKWQCHKCWREKLK